MEPVTTQRQPQPQQQQQQQEKEEKVIKDSKLITLWILVKTFVQIIYLIPKGLIKTVWKYLQFTISILLINPLLHLTSLITGNEYSKQVRQWMGIIFSIILCITSIYSCQQYFYPELPSYMPIKVPNTSFGHLFPNYPDPPLSNNWIDLMEQIKQIWSRLEGDGYHLQQQVSRLQSEFNHHLQIHELDQKRVWSDLQNKQSQLNLLKQFIDSKLETTTREQQQQRPLDDERNLVSASPAIDDNNNLVDPEQIKSLIQSAIYKYHQDILDEADYALKTRDASVLYSLTSPTYYHAPAWQQSIFRFVGLVTDTNSPELAISPQTHVGRCWSMDGSNGTLGIVLSEPIFIDGISIEYPSPNLMQHRMKHAPKLIELFGISNYPKRPARLVSLGTAEYDVYDTNSTVQTFKIDSKQILFKAVQVRFHSNWGSEEHTDIYRVRIHGQPIINNL